MISAVIADLVILAVDTLKVAVCEEDVTYPFGTADHGLFTPVDADG
jgi:hypothetical protein